MSLMSKTDFRKVVCCATTFCQLFTIRTGERYFTTVGTFQRLSDVLDFSACFFRWGPIFSGGATGNAK